MRFFTLSRYSKVCFYLHYFKLILLVDASRAYVLTNPPTLNCSIHRLEDAQAINRCMCSDESGEYVLTNPRALSRGIHCPGIRGSQRNRARLSPVCRPLQCHLLSHCPLSIRSIQPTRVQIATVAISLCDALKGPAIAAKFLAYKYADPSLGGKHISEVTA